MIPATYDIELYRGDTFRRTFRIRSLNADGTPGAYVDLTDAVPLAQVRTTNKAPEILQTFTASVLDQTDPNMLGGVLIELDPLQTADLPDASRWDIQLTHSNGDVVTYLMGAVKATGQVTF